VSAIPDPAEGGDLQRGAVRRLPAPPWRLGHFLLVIVGLWAAGWLTQWLLQGAHLVPAGPDSYREADGLWYQAPGAAVRLLTRDLGKISIFIALLTWGVRAGRVRWADLGLRAPRKLVFATFGVGLFTGLLVLSTLWRAGSTDIPAEPRLVVASNPLHLYWPLLEGRRGLLLMVIHAGILLPLLEEVLFRGMLYRRLRVRAGFVASAALCAVAFAVYIALARRNPNLLLGSACLGFLFAWLAERSESVLPGAVASGVWNLAAMMALLLGLPT
jgi:membrane protease YdiL (CAAX protease family)